MKNYLFVSDLDGTLLTSESEFSKKTVKYIKARHYAVLAYAYLRMTCLYNFAKNVIFGFFSSPTLFCSVLFYR